MKEGGPAKPRYKSECDGNGNFVWKDGVSFSLSPDQVNPRFQCLYIYYQGDLCGRAELCVDDECDVSVVDIHPQYKQVGGLGANLVEGINAYLDHFGYKGSLVDLIGRQDFGDYNKRGLYARHGWVGGIDMTRQPKPKKDSE